MNIYVGNLNYRVKEGDLQQVMEDYGAVSSVKVVMDRETGKSKGFAFIEMEDDAAAFSITHFRLRSLHCGGKREGSSKRRQQPRRSNELSAGNRHDEPPALSVSARSPAISNALAIATADRTPSFLAALPRWSLTVGNEIDSRSAICLLSSP